ncbi:hypothetical protein WBG06_04120 [Nocardioides sp. CCNWLW239]|uniref:hypothetical protein n=1 Tax=Nocardioides sp. CCNWLW239 TaxID=3128902 RepID=UPI00301AF1A6
MKEIRVPMTAASRMGVSALAAKSAEGRVVLTSHGRAVAVIGSAEHLDEDLRALREATARVLDAVADIVSARGRLLSLEETCERLGVDVERVRSRVAENRDVA